MLQLIKRPTSNTCIVIYISPMEICRSVSLEENEGHFLPGLRHRVEPCPDELVDGGWKALYSSTRTLVRALVLPCRVSPRWVQQGRHWESLSREFLEGAVDPSPCTAPTLLGFNRPCRKPRWHSQNCSIETQVKQFVYASFCSWDFSRIPTQRLFRESPRRPQGPLLCAVFWSVSRCVRCVPLATMAGHSATTSGRLSTGSLSAGVPCSARPASFYAHYINRCELSWLNI